MDPNLEIRLERSRSWISVADDLSRAGESSDAWTRPGYKNLVSQAREHERFIFYWVAFNCLYGRRYYDGSKADQETDIQKFLKKVEVMSQLDRKNYTTILDNAIKESYSHGRKLILDRFLDDRYWRGQRKVHLIVRENEEKWRQAEANLHLRGDFDSFLRLVFDRLRVLRNQIMHGCAKYGPESRGFKSLVFGVRFLEVMVPAFHRLTEIYGEHVNWEKAPYPRRRHAEHPW